MRCIRSSFYCYYTRSSIIKSVSKGVEFVEVIKYYSPIVTSLHCAKSSLVTTSLCNFNSISSRLAYWILFNFKVNISKQIRTRILIKCNILFKFHHYRSLASVLSSVTLLYNIVIFVFPSCKAVFYYSLSMYVIY